MSRLRCVSTAILLMSQPQLTSCSSFEVRWIYIKDVWYQSTREAFYHTESSDGRVVTRDHDAAAFEEIRQPANQHPERVDGAIGDTDLALDLSGKLVWIDTLLDSSLEFTLTTIML